MAAVRVLMKTPEISDVSPFQPFESVDLTSSP